MATVLLIHGGLWEDMDADRFWRRPGIVAGLSDRGYRVLAPDRLRRAPNWADETAHVASISGIAAGEPATVVGGSFGCAVAVRLALSFPGLVRRVVLAWPAAVSDQFVAIRVRADLSRLGARARVLDALLGSGGVLPGVSDAELGGLSLPLGVLPSVPPNPVHARGTVDRLLRLLPAAVELPGCPEAPRPDFPPYLESFLSTIVSFAEQ
jgi:pimeloyl-ACP methyl ester carboxylesterase